MKIKKVLSIFLAIIFVFTFFNLSNTYAAGIPNVGIQKRVNVINARAGDIITYTLLITNIGNANAVGVVVTDNLPAGFTYTDTGLTSRQWYYVSLSPGEVIEVTYNAKISDSIIDGVYRNIAIVSASNHGSVKDKAEISIRPFSTMQILSATQNITASTTNIVTPEVGNTNAALTNEDNVNEELLLGETGVSFYDVLLWLIAFAILIVSLYKFRSIKYKHESR